MKTLRNEEIRKVVRETYGGIAKGESAGCGCGCVSENHSGPEELSMNIGYSGDDVSSVPEGANLGLGCGNPKAIASLKPGETVLDLGSGGGFDCLLAARAVGASGRVIGVDMTPEMIQNARLKAVEAGFDNVSFRLGEIENLPVADNSVDVVISNCVINLSPEKANVFNEAFRVLKRGGRLAIADIVATAPLPDEVKQDLELYAGCVAGAALIDELGPILEDVGFSEVRIKPIYRSGELIRKLSPDRPIEDLIASVSIEALKP